MVDLQKSVSKWKRLPDQWWAVWRRYANDRDSMLYPFLPLAFYFLCLGEYHPSSWPSSTLALWFRSYHFIWQTWFKHPHVCHPWTISLPGKMIIKRVICAQLGDVSTMGVTPFGWGLGGVTERCHFLRKSFLAFSRHHYCSILMSSQRHIAHQLTAWSFSMRPLPPHHLCHYIKGISRSWTVLLISYLVNVQWLK